MEDTPSNWNFPDVELTQIEERLVIATMVQIGIIIMMNTHLYTFNTKIFLQQEGGPIGLRATCAVARVTMNAWDVKWKTMLYTNNIRLDSGSRYMDDIRAFLDTIREGWRWWEGSLAYCEAWRMMKIQPQKPGEQQQSSREA